MRRMFLTSDSFRYAFRSTEKVALQEIGPRFTLKLRWLKKNIPAVQNFGEDAKPLTFDTEDDPFEEQPDEQKQKQNEQGNGKEETEETGPPARPVKKVVPPKQDEYIWQWKVGFRFDLLNLRLTFSLHTARVRDHPSDILFVILCFCTSSSNSSVSLPRLLRTTPQVFWPEYGRSPRY